MKLKLTIDSTDNAAFRDNPEGVYGELADILELAAAKIRDGLSSGWCADSNGNQVGQWSISGHK